jgi:hypothetical protein
MKALVITTINPPTLALFKYKDILLDLGWRIIVVGDRKTPPDFDLPGVDFLNIEKQQEICKEFADLVPFNHYARKNIGYLYAIREGAEAIAESDDDNIPYPDRYPNFLPTQAQVPVLQDEGCVNVYSYFTDQRIWPRGLPLDCMNKAVNSEKISESEVTCYIQQGLADLDPDVDAIYRLTTTNSDTVFEPEKSLALAPGCYCPINTQNTIFYREAFPLLLLPVAVNSRVTDIWKGYIAQRLLWDMGSQLVFLSPSVYQIRNAHNLLQDFQGEIDLYTKSHELVELLNTFKAKSSNPCDLMLEMYTHLTEAKFFDQKELELCQTWIQAIIKYI